MVCPLKYIQEQCYLNSQMAPMHVEIKRMMMTRPTQPMQLSKLFGGRPDTIPSLFIKP